MHSPRILLPALATFIISIMAMPLQAQATTAPADSTSCPAGHASAWQHETSYAGAPLFVAGALIGLQQKDYRAMRNAFIPKFNSPLDNFSQYSPLAVTALLKLCGVQTRSSWTRLGVETAISAVFMGTMVNGIKYTAKEMRPDNTTRNSFPSGHTALSFMSATIMSKELGWRSPWYSIGAYTVATTTGLFRIFNNRHWVNDVVFGAGIGITSVDLGYFVSDLIFKEKQFSTGFYGRRGMTTLPDKPSFLSIGMSVGYISNLAAPDIYDAYADDMTPATGATPLNLKLNTGATTSLVAEGACFFNSNIGIGGRLRAIACPITAEFNSNFHPYTLMYNDQPLRLYSLEGIESASLGLINLDFGPYFSCPITPRLNIGGKLLLGDCITTDFSLNSYSTLGNAYKQHFAGELQSGAITQESYDEMTSGVADREFMHISPSHALNVGVGLSLTLAVKSHSALRIFADYTHSAPEYTYSIYSRVSPDISTEFGFIEDTFKRRTRLNEFSAGVSLMAMF
jgi:membrane-associated phospholipid phosphatase